MQCSLDYRINFGVINVFEPARKRPKWIKEIGFLKDFDNKFATIYDLVKILKWGLYGYELS